MVSWSHDSSCLVINCPGWFHHPLIHHHAETFSVLPAMDPQSMVTGSYRSRSREITERVYFPRTPHSQPGYGYLIHGTRGNQRVQQVHFGKTRWTMALWWRKQRPDTGVCGRPSRGLVISAQHHGSAQR